MPWFVEFQDRYQESGFTVLAVSMDQQGWEVVRPFIEEQGLNLLVFVGDRDFGEAFGGVDVLPITFIVDRTGKITARHRGSSTNRSMRKRSRGYSEGKPEGGPRIDPGRRGPDIAARRNFR